MFPHIKLLDTVALLSDLPDAGLRRGQVGTTVEHLAPDVFAVEFSDDQGRTYALVSIQVDVLLPLVYEAVGS